MIHENDAEIKEKNISDSEQKNDTKDISQNQEGSSDAEEKNNKELQEELLKKEKEYNELFDRMQRLAAEYDNFRKRTQKEKEKIYGDSVCEVVANFLTIVDNLERALEAANEEENSLKSGVELVYRQLIEVLEKIGVKPIEAVGKPFNPEIHNAVMHIEDENLDDNIVAEEFQKGYIYKDEIVIRYSMVTVAN